MIEKLDLRAKIPPLPKGGFNGDFLETPSHGVIAEISPGPSFSKRGNLIYHCRRSFEIASREPTVPKAASWRGGRLRPSIGTSPRRLADDPLSSRCRSPCLR
jgi:hypothetical protein